MRLLFVIPHYFSHHVGADARSNRRHASQSVSSTTRAATLRKTVMALHQMYSPSQRMIQIAERCTIPANQSLRHHIHVVIASVGNAHLHEQAGIPIELAQRHFVNDDPMNLGFHCHKLLRDRWGDYDFYGYLEDDLVLSDPWFFEKLRWFNSHVGDDKLLMPNRFERSETLAYKKCYVDGDLAARVTQPFQDVAKTPELQSTFLGQSLRFVRPLNPHSGCFFLNATQMRRWFQRPRFGIPVADFISPLESAATLGVMQTFAIYKPAPENAGFLEIEHDGCQFIKLIRRGESPSQDSAPSHQGD